MMESSVARRSMMGERREEGFDGDHRRRHRHGFWLLPVPVRSPDIRTPLTPLEFLTIFFRGRLSLGQIT